MMKMAAKPARVIWRYTTLSCKWFQGQDRNEWQDGRIGSPVSHSNFHLTLHLCLSSVGDLCGSQIFIIKCHF